MAFEPTLLPPNVIAGLREMAEAFHARNVAYAVIGGVATSYRSRPRTTRDVDFIVDVPQLALPALLEDLHQRGFEFDLEMVIRQYVQQYMTVLNYRGVRLDWLKPVLPLFRHVIDKAPLEEWLGARYRVAAPESLILTKLLSFRSQDQVDIENLLEANPGSLNLEYIHQEWLTVADPDDPRMLKFEKMVVSHYKSPSEHNPSK